MESPLKRTCEKLLGRAIRDDECVTEVLAEIASRGLLPHLNNPPLSGREKSTLANMSE